MVDENLQVCFKEEYCLDLSNKSNLIVQLTKTQQPQINLLTNPLTRQINLFKSEIKLYENGHNATLMLTALFFSSLQPSAQTWRTKCCCLVSSRLPCTTLCTGQPFRSPRPATSGKDLSQVCSWPSSAIAIDSRQVLIQLSWMVCRTRYLKQSIFLIYTSLLLKRWTNGLEKF